MIQIYSWGFNLKYAVLEPGSGWAEDLGDSGLTRSAGDWIVPTFVRAPNSRKRKLPLGDFSATTGFMHLLSPRALKAVGEEFAAYGLLLPVAVEGEADDWALFQVSTVIDCLQVEASEIARAPFPPYRITSIVKPVFDAEKCPSRGLFTVPESASQNVYVCTDVKDLIVANRLKGFVLSSGMFEEQWIS